MGVILGSRAARWHSARAEHEEVVQGFSDAVLAIGKLQPERWRERPDPDRWNGAETTLHVINSYELGTRAIVNGEPGMRMRVSPATAWLARTVVLPILLVRRTFPMGAPSPREVRPDAEEALALTPEAAAQRLERATREAVQVLRAADDRRPRPRVAHSVFGPLGPLRLLQLLSAHTRHHLQLLGVPAHIVARPVPSTDEIRAPRA